ncbi:hypothetical protein BH11PLA2_BH11PLA2_19790 [soil metagenome]
MTLLYEFLITLFWPAAAAVSLAVAVGGDEVTAFGLVLLACGTMSGYGLDRLMDRKDRDPPSFRRQLRNAVVLTSLIAFACACTSWWRFEISCLLGVLAGGYVPLKRMVPKNWLTVSGWTIAVTCLPFAAAPDFTDRHHAAWIAVALIMFTNTTLCDLNSVEEDRRNGVRGVAPYFGVRIAAMICDVSASLAVGIAAYHQHPGLTACAAVLVPLAVYLGRNPKNRTAHTLVDLAITLIPGPVTVLVGLF